MSLIANQIKTFRFQSIFLKNQVLMGFYFWLSYFMNNEGCACLFVSLVLMAIVIVNLMSYWPIKLLGHLTSKYSFKTYVDNN